MENNKYKYIYERYCPDISQKITVEEDVDEDGHIEARCHNYPQCKGLHGSCTNSMLNMDYSYPGMLAQTNFYGPPIAASQGVPIGIKSYEDVIPPTRGNVST